MVAAGASNRDAAARLFLSPRPSSSISPSLPQAQRALAAELARLMAMELPEGERDPVVLADALS